MSNRGPNGGFHRGVTRSTEEQRGHTEHFTAAEAGDLDRFAGGGGGHENPQLSVENQVEALGRRSLLDERLAGLELNQPRLAHGLAKLIIVEGLEECVSSGRGNDLVDRLSLNGG